ncbi:MAG: 50S ribosomal protein L31e [Candidatus Aenigmarchaeota archaeon]|nr:50S ribosomal protein L31e [Candidatus Aenigmarchaeota archaeon]
MVEEKIYHIPLRTEKKARVKRAPYAVSIVRNYLIKHTGASNIKIGSKLNETIWSRGTKKPPKSVRVRAVVDGSIVKAELIGFDYTDFTAKKREKKMGMREKLMQRLGPKAIKKEEEEKKIEGKPVEKAEEKKVDAEQRAAEEVTKKSETKA